MEEIFNTIVDGLSSAAKAVIGLLPTSPFQAYLSVSIDSQYLRWLNWLVPVGQMIAVLQMWLVAIGLWYVYQVILRWAKAIQ